MAKKKVRTQPSEKYSPNYLRFLLIFPILLIQIGDAIRDLMAFCIYLLKALSVRIGRLQHRTDTTQQKVKTSQAHTPGDASIDRHIPWNTQDGSHSKNNWKFFSFPFIRLPSITTALHRLVHPTGQSTDTNSSIGSQNPPRRRTSLISIRLKYFTFGVISTLVFVFIPINTRAWLRTLPNPHLLTGRDIEVSTKIFDRNGVLLYEIYVDQNRTPIPLDEIPLNVQKATIAIEDRDFYNHQGFSIRGIARATRETILNKRLQGGSTITQQLIKSALLNPEIKISRKIKEIFLAFWAERIYTKNKILEMYLSQVPYGGTAWGIEAASQTYFNKSVSELSLGEAALLAGLPAAPTEYSPFGSHPEKAFDRQREVLRRMVEDEYITQEEADAAMVEYLQFAQPNIGIRAPHFVMYVKNILEKTYGARQVERGGLRVRTSLDITLQEKAQEIVKSQIQDLADLRVGNGAAVLINPKSGEILTMVGSKDYFDIQNEGNVNVATSIRPPGSAIKVVTYATALENGYTAATILDDSPVAYRIAGSPTYVPVNYDSRFHGLVPLRYALGNSYNIPAVKVLSHIGLKSMIDYGRKMGIQSWNDDRAYGLSLTLGGGGTTMLDMVRVFSTLANGGKSVDLMPILEITDYTGKTIKQYKNPRTTQVLSPETSWILGNILSDNAARTSAFGPNSSLVIPGKTVSVKTGTSNEKRDNWTIGYTPSYVAAVWVGNNDNSPMDPLLTSGITGASTIWHDIMSEILKDKIDEVLPKPESVIAIPCYYGKLEYFTIGTEPPGGRCTSIPSPSISPGMPTGIQPR